MKIGFIGVGHMGSSLVRAIKDYQNVTLYFNDIDNQKACALKEEISDSEVKDFNEIVDTVHYLFIGVKPNDANEVFRTPNGNPRLFNCRDENEPWLLEL